ncbi:MAG: two-component system chemotaxis response regulator CheB [Planctomycetota bacterium]
MTTPIQVLVVDDSVVIRKVLKDSLSEDPLVRVDDVAANGQIALRKIRDKAPDLVILDLDMPVMNGLETLKAIRESWPKLPVILFSGHSNHEASAGLEAMEFGANAIIAKPSNLDGRHDSSTTINEQLLPMIKSLCIGDVEVMRSQGLALPKSDAAATAKRVPRSANSNQMAVLAIGSSTGGPNALAELIGSLPASFPVPIVVTQHMPPNFTRHLAERLNKASGLSVVEAEPGMKLKAGWVYIAPGDFHMTVERMGTDVVIQTNQGPLENSCRPAVDPMLRSVADVYGASSLVVILTGMGSDGLKGCEQIHKLGGRIFTQDEESSVVWGMPGFVSRAGLSERDIPLSQVGGAITRCFPNHKGTAAASTPVPAPTVEVVKSVEPDENKSVPEVVVALLSMRQVLVVDDSRAVRSILSRIMRDIGFDPIEAKNGLEAINQIEDGVNPELALVDWNMPEMSGIELIEALRDRDDLDDLKIVMVTSETEVDCVQKALACGADEYVMKPFSKDELLARLTKIGLLY